MKRFFSMWLLMAAFVCNAVAEKTVYIPATWSYNATTQEYTEGGNSDLQWSFNRSKQTENCIIFWQKGFGDDPSKAARLNGADMTFNVDEVLQVAETCYALNVGTLGFANSNMLNKYKLMILMNYTDTWTCYGGGYDYECSALWLNPSTVKPAGHALAHEVGHSFHYMCYAEATDYNHNSSTTDNTGFHLECGKGQAVWEQTAQWQACQAFPDMMYQESIGIFRNSHNYAYSHEWHRYQSYWLHYYLCEHYNDITTVAQVWRQPMKNQSNGNASDFNQALMALKNLSARNLYKMYFDYACRLVTWDLDACKPYRLPYIGDFNYRCALTDEGDYQVALSSCPQGSGFNVIPLSVPAAGTTVTTHLTGMPVASPLADADPGEFLNGDSQFEKRSTRSYVNPGNTYRSYRGFRMGYVALMQDGTRRYFSEDSVYCQGIKSVTEDYSFTVPEGVSQLWLVISPALKNYITHRWDDTIEADDMWPYRFSLEGTDLTSKATVYASPTLDGRTVSDVTLTYDVTFPPQNSWGGSVAVYVSGKAAATLGTAFQMATSDIAGKLQTWSTSGPANGKMMFFAANADGTLAQSGSTANGYGHWFNGNGAVCNYSDVNASFYSEFDPTALGFVIGQYPSRLSTGNTCTLRQAIKYRKNPREIGVATFVFNITLSSATSAVLRSIDYDDPTGISLTPSPSPMGEGSGCYDLSGRQVTKPQRGIYILNGKKTLVK